MIQAISYWTYFKRVFQASIAWALCITLFEVFKTITSTSIRYIDPIDVLFMTSALFLAYSIIWFCVLMLVSFFMKSFWQKRGLPRGGIALVYWCLALLLYELFWVFYKTGAEGRFHSLHGLFLSFIHGVSALLVAFAAYKLIVMIREKGFAKQMGAELSAFGVSALGYMMAYVYLKSFSQDGYIQPLYVIVLFIAFIVIFRIFLLILKKLHPILLRMSIVNTAQKTRLIILVLVPVSLLVFLAYQAPADKSDMSSRPNVLFISIDTLRADHISSYGERKKVTSPNIDKIAREGFLFKRAYSPTSWTLPAHASMMTGLFPSSHNADRSLKQTMSRPVDPLSSSVVTLAEILKENGYQTAGIISNPFLSSSFGMHRGFEFYDDKVDLFEDIRYLSLKDYSMLFKMLKFLKIINRNDYDGERRVLEVNERAFTWLESNKDRKSPFFLFLHYNEPHFLYEPPVPYNRSDDGQYLDYFNDIESLVNGQYSLSSGGLRDLITLYDGEITYMDFHLGSLFRKLSEGGVLDNTLLIITADHGESFNEHEIWQHGNSLFEEQIRVPMIIRYPKCVPNGKVDNDHIVSLVDLMPTILDLLKLPIPENVHGRSLLPLFTGKAGTKFDLTFAEIRPDINWKAKNPRFGEGIRAVIKNEWKFIEHDNGSEELYKLDTDPSEKINLAAMEKDKADEMRDILKSWKRLFSSKGKNNQEKIDGGRLEQLRSLGYLQ